LRETSSKQTQIDLPFVGAILAANEILLGSILHGFRLPFGGQTLSLIQITFMSIVSQRANDYSESMRNPFYISSSSSLLKTISPAGNKLGPMLSIWMQGLLFCVGVAVFGHNFIGRLIGSMISALWAFIQPILTLYIFFGESLFDGFRFYAEKIVNITGFEPQSITAVFFIAVLIKVILSIVAGFVIPYFFHENVLLRSETLFQRNKQKVTKILLTRKNNRGSTMMLALQDLCKPVYFLSLILGIVFFCFSSSSYAQMIWLSLRPIAVAYLFFLVSRSKRISTLLDTKLGKSNQSALYQHFMQVMEYLSIDSTRHKKRAT